MFLLLGCRRFMPLLLKLRWEEELLDESERRGRRRRGRKEEASRETGRKKKKKKGKKRIKIWRKGNASVKLQWADRWSRYDVFLRACVERERKRIISYSAWQRDWWRRFSPYFMLLFDSVGHYFRLRREMLSGSRFILLPLSPFLPLSPLCVLFLSLSPFNYPLPSPRLSSATDNPKREKYVEFSGRFLANLTSSLMQPPCSSHDFDPRNHRHSTRCLPFSSASLYFDK